jgi:hypothetical protein
VRLLSAIATSLALLAAPVAAQRDPARLEVVLPAEAARGREAPTIRTGNVLAERNLRELLHSGFPARLHYRLELWQAGGLFDNLRSQAEWDVIVRYNPLERRYSATRIEGERVASLGSYEQLDGAVRAMSAPFRPALSPPARGGRYYYIAVLDVEMLSVNDLSEVERWLRGELTPAFHGERNPGTALSRGAQTLVTRLLGGRTMHYEARTGVFRR